MGTITHHSPGIKLTLGLQQGRRAGQRRASAACTHWRRRGGTTSSTSSGAARQGRSSRVGSGQRCQSSGARAAVSEQRHVSLKELVPKVGALGQNKEGGHARHDVVGAGQHVAQRPVLAHPHPPCRLRAVPLRALVRHIGPAAKVDLSEVGVARGKDVREGGGKA